MPEPAANPGAITPSRIPVASPDVVAALRDRREGVEVEARTQFRMALDRFVHHRVALIGLAVFLAMILFATIGPLFWHYSYSQITNDVVVHPSGKHPFGTDTIGRDLFAQVMAAEATSVKTALLVAVIATAIGTLLGAVAGFYGRWADAVLMRFTDLVLVIPAIAILLVLSNKLAKQANSWFAVALVLAVVLWTYLSRLVRSAFLSLREREFIEAARAIGADDGRIIFRHMIPNAIGAIVVNATLTVANAILFESFLSYLGLGIQPPAVSLGQLVALYQDDAVVFPWLFYFPAGFLIVTILAVNFIGDGLRDALDPTQRVRA